MIKIGILFICLILLFTGCSSSHEPIIEQYEGTVIATADIVFSNRLNSSAIIGTAIYLDNGKALRVQDIVHLEIGEYYVIQVEVFKEPMRSGGSEAVINSRLISLRIQYD